MTNEERKKLKGVIKEITRGISTIDFVMKTIYNITDSQFNQLRQAHDELASARDVIERLTKNS